MYQKSKYSGIFFADTIHLIMVMTAKCHAPAPLGVGTMTAILPTTKSTSPAIHPKPAEKLKQ